MITPLTQPVLHRPPTPAPAPAPAVPQFGGARPGMFLRMFDFAMPGVTVLNANKLIYATTIASRLLESRSKNEFLEVARRDPFGWFFWYYGSPLMQTFLITGLMDKAAQNLLKCKVGKPMQLGPSKLHWLINPADRFYITTNNQLEQRMQQIVGHMARQRKSPAAIDMVKSQFRRAIQLRSLTSFIGLVFAIAAVGIGTTWINFALTGNDLKRRLAAEQSNRQALDRIRQAQPLYDLDGHPLSTGQLMAMDLPHRKPAKIKRGVRQQPAAPATRNGPPFAQANPFLVTARPDIQR